MVRAILFVFFLFALFLLAITLLPFFSLLRWMSLLVLLSFALWPAPERKFMLFFFSLFSFPLLLPLAVSASPASVLSFLVAIFSVSTFPYLFSSHREEVSRQQLVRALTGIMVEGKKVSEVLGHIFPELKVRYSRLVKRAHDHPFSFSGSLLAIPYRQGALILGRAHPFTEAEKRILFEIVEKAALEERRVYFYKIQERANRNLTALFAYFPEGYFLYDTAGALQLVLVPQVWQREYFFSFQEFILERLDLPPHGFCLRLRQVISDQESAYQEALLYIAHELKTALTSLLFLLDEEKKEPELIQQAWERIWWLLQHKSSLSLAKEQLFSKKEVEAFIARILKKRALFTWEGQETFPASPLVLYPVLSNLSYNALYYSPLGSPVAFDFHCSKDKLTLKVTNMVAPPSFPFQLSHGLGLELVKRLVQGIKGEMRWEKRGENFTIVLHLPLHRLSKNQP